MEENEATITTPNDTIKNEPLEDKKMVYVNNEIDEENVIIQESPGKSNYLQISKEDIKQEIEIKKEPIQFEETKEEINFKKDEPNENEEFSYKELILKALDTVDTIPGAFACGGILPKTKLQLSVESVGNIKLPLSDEQADVLKTKCMAAPFGRGNKTLVNKSVRDAWQIDAEDVTINVEFDEMIKDKMSEIIPHLMGELFTEDIQQSVMESHRLELYKLVLYKKGGHFVAHRDTEKSPGMFATLVIQLPAGHKGGALVINHKGYTEVFNHENGSRNSVFFTAFFADCEHELRKITDGHRLVLIYNIIRKNHHPNNEVNYSQDEKFVTTMKKAVKKWKSDNNGPYYLAKELDFLYTDANISFKNLKGNDKKISDALCSVANIEVYLATLTKFETRHGNDYDPYDRYRYNRYDSYNSDESEDDSMSHEESENYSMNEEDESLRESYCSLTNWIGVNNKKKNFKEHDLGEKEMLINQEEMFKENYDLHKSAIEYTGNEGCSQEYTYKKTAIVITPRNFAFIAACKEDLTSVIDKCKNASEQGKAWKMFCGIMNYIKRNNDYETRKHLEENDNVAIICDLLSTFENKIESANIFLKSLLDIGLPTENSGVTLANLINKLSWEYLGANVLELVKRHASTQRSQVEQLVKSMLALGLQEQAIKVVELGTHQIIDRKNVMSRDSLALWLSFLTSYDIFSSQYNDLFQQILNMDGNIIIEIIVKMHKSLPSEITGQNKIMECFQNIIKYLQDKGWKNCSKNSVILIIPVLVFVEKNELLNNLVQEIIQLENSSDFLEPILKLPIILREKDNPSVQLMVQTRLRQLEKCEPIFSWAQPNATLENRSIYDRSYRSGPSVIDVQNFLRSDVQSRMFGHFDNLQDARFFGKKHFNDGNYNWIGQYSAAHVISGRGKSAKCTVSKTRNYFDEQMKKYANLCSQAEDLRKKFFEPKNTLAKKRALE